jgi:hypothetical protein
MSRSLDREEQKSDSSSGFEALSRSGGENRPRASAPEETEGFGDNQRERVAFRDREYRIRPSEDAVLNELGRFRIIREDDLVRGIYGNQKALAASDLRSLRQQGLLRSITFQGLSNAPTRIHTLTGAGYDLVNSRGSGAQFYYWGAVKPAEVQHDALLYRAYLHERDRIRDGGFTIKRIVLDSELKRNHYSRINKPAARASYRRAQLESAKELHLPVVDGHVAFPDFRIEYEDERGDLSRVDVEVATSNYRGAHLAAKVAAGFRVYGPSGGYQVQSGGRLKGNAFPQETRAVFPL